MAQPLALPSFYDTTVADSDARAAVLMKQGRYAAAVGQGVRGAAGAVVNKLAAPLRAAVPAVGDFVSGLTGNTELPTMPAVTKNAVLGPSVNASAGETGGTPQPFPSAPASPTSPAPTSPLDAPAPTATSTPGITRYDTPGESPLFTNLSQSDFANKRSPNNALASVPGFLNTVKEFTGSVSPQPSNTGGLFPPGLDANLANIMSRSQALLGSNSIVDNWRGRQLAKMYDRLQQGGVAAANAVTSRAGVGVQAGHLANEMPIAELQSSTARRGQDASVFPHIGLAGIQNTAYKRLQAGGPNAVDEARSIAEIGVPRFGPAERPLQKSTLPDGTQVFTDPNTGEVVKQITLADSQALAKKKAQDAVAAGLPKPNGR